MTITGAGLVEPCVIRPRSVPRRPYKRAAVPNGTDNILRAAVEAAQTRNCRCGGDHTKSDLHAALWLIRDHYERIEHVKTTGIKE